MDAVTIENFRCFGERQTVRLAPLTLLVGENSTGKTSFLALIRALADLGYGLRLPDFKEAPYDMGSYDDVVHRSRRDKGIPGHFDASFKTARYAEGGDEPFEFSFRFSKYESVPHPVASCYSRGQTRILESINDSRDKGLTVSTKRGAWDLQPSDETARRLGRDATLNWLTMWSEVGQVDPSEFAPHADGPSMSSKDREEIGSLAFDLMHQHVSRPRAGAPIRSQPRRTYDYARPTYDPEGEHIPNLLASFAAQDSELWSEIQEYLETFGVASGLFDEIRIKRFGTDSEPFQLQVRKNLKRRKGLWRNIKDVGYGVSQVLPVVTEIAFHREPDVFLLEREMLLFQQPEVHLHPRAQAELGTLLSSFAVGHERQQRYLVETHSDHLINRVRMDVRDCVNGLTPGDVVVLYFERRDFDVKIHEITFDELGNLNGAPPSYGDFFMRETSRSIWPDADLADL